MGSVLIESLTEEHILFDKQNNEEKIYTPIPISINEVGAKAIVLRDTKILGQMIFIPNTLSGNKSWLFINLVVDKKCENIEKVVYDLIMTAAMESQQKNIFLGYFWVNGQEGIETRTWYRPLILKRAKRLDYELNKKGNYLLGPTDEYEMKPSDNRDFSFIHSTTELKLTPTEEEFKCLSKVINFFTVTMKKNQEIIGIVGCRKYKMYKPDVEYTGIQLCYFDSSPLAAAPVLTILFKHLRENNYPVVHGVLMSGIEKAVKELNITLTKPTKLHLVKGECDVNKISKVAILCL
jgi:hypothetical protein